MELYTPQNWQQYQLIDSGNFRKLEKFGNYVLIRPEPQAVWPPSMTEEQWQLRAHAEFVQKGSSQGDWLPTKNKKRVPENWQIHYKGEGFKLSMKLALTQFKHVGLFPEQASNWEFIHEQCLKKPSMKVLNLFAYTGGASLAAKAAGADVIHCDSIRQVVNWANQNMELSKLVNIRWLVEDALKFVKKEAKRGNTYNGLMLDPPSWGHGPKGEKWKLEEQISELMEGVGKIVKQENSFVVFNSYSLGFSPLILKNLVDHYTPFLSNREVGELVLKDEFGKMLPAGVVARCTN